MLDALIAIHKRQPSYLDGARAGAEVPSAKWTKQALLAYGSEKGIGTSVDWNKDRILLALLNGPTAADVADLNRRGELRADAVRRGGALPKRDAAPADDDEDAAHGEEADPEPDHTGE